MTSRTPACGELARCQSRKTTDRFSAAAVSTSKERSARTTSRAGNDVVPTVLCAALILPLAFLTLRRLAAAGQSTRTPTDDVWLTLALGFGTVLCFASVQGRVWFTAHVLGVLLAMAYAWASIEARRPILEGRIRTRLDQLARQPETAATPASARAASRPWNWSPVN